MIPGGDGLDREWLEANERSERRQFEDRQHRREMRTLTTISAMAFTAIALVTCLIARGCSAGAQRTHETEMACVSHGGTWQGAPDNNCIMPKNRETA